MFCGMMSAHTEQASTYSASRNLHRKRAVFVVISVKEQENAMNRGNPATERLTLATPRG
jgi:hypothetical protein